MSIKKYFKSYLDVCKEIDDNFSNKDFFISKIVSFILATFLVSPFVLVDINLLYLFYDYEVMLVVGLILLFYVLVFLYTKFYLDVFKAKYRFINNVKYLYINNLILALIASIIVFVIYFISVR